MPRRKLRFRPKPPPRQMQSIFAMLGRKLVWRIFWAVIGLIVLGMAVAILLFGKVPEPESMPGQTFDTRDVLLMSLGWMGISALSYVGWQLTMHEVHAWGGKKPIRILWNSILVVLNILVILLVIEVFILRLNGQTWESLGFRPISWPWVAGSIGLGLLSMILSGAAAALFLHATGQKWVNPQEGFILPSEQSTMPIEASPPEQESPTQPRARLSILGALAMILLIGVAVPVVEEMLFRGVIYAWMTTWMPWMLALIVSSILFGLAHFESGLPVVVACAVGGLFMAAAFHYSHSLYAPILIHAVNNLTKVSLTYLLRE